MSVVDGIRAAKRGDLAGVGKSGLDIGMGALAFAGPIGLGFSVAYYAVDQTVGWNWLKALRNAQQQYRNESKKEHCNICLLNH